MLVAVVLAIVLVATSVMVHYEVLRTTSYAMTRMAISPRQRLLVVIGAALVAHLVEIIVFAIGYQLLAPIEGEAVLVGRLERDVLDYLYFSAATFTTLGIGDVFPLGVARLVAGVESLTGLILIGWTASFTYLAMREFWGLHAARRISGRKRAADSDAAPGRKDRD